MAQAKSDTLEICITKHFKLFVAQLMKERMSSRGTRLGKAVIDKCSYEDSCTVQSVMNVGVIFRHLYLCQIM